MDFADVKRGLVAGHRFERTGWNGKGMWIELQVPDEHSKMTLPYIFIHTPQGELVPWLPSQSDLMADDWINLSAQKATP